MFKQGFGHGLSVAGSQRGAFGGAQAYGNGRFGLVRTLGATVRLPDEITHDLCHLIACGLVDDVYCQFQRGRPGAGGKFRELARRLCRTAS